MSLNGYAQSEFNTKFKAIPAKNKNLKVKKIIPPKADLPKISPPKVEKKPEPSLPVKVPNNFSMLPKNDFINPGDVYKDKLNKKEENKVHLLIRWLLNALFARNLIMLTVQFNANDFEQIRNKREAVTLPFYHL